MQQQQHGRLISQRIIHSHFYKHARHIALYLHGDGEVDLSLLINKLHSYKKKCYLPVILSRQRATMAFAPYERHTRLRKNCFGILEPVYQKKQLKTARQLDLVLTPLVAFDAQGNRMGMGGGFYDRALQHLGTQQRRFLKPIVIGVAHEVQRVAQLQSHHWDIPLDAIVTENGMTLFTP